MNSSAQEIEYVDGVPDHAVDIHTFLTPYFDRHQLLPRTQADIARLIEHSFVAQVGRQIAGFAALEIYSPKLAEIQCLAVGPDFRRRGIGRELVQRCVDRAGQVGVLELMAISASDEMFLACGFDYSLPNQKRALFIQPSAPAENQSDD